jgi:hypothetical protein
VRFEVDFRLLMVASAVLAVAFASALLGAPALVAEIFGIELAPGGRVVARLWGVELLGVGLVCWFLRSLPSGSWRSGLLLSFLLADLTGIVVVLHALLAGHLNAVGWLALAVYVVLAALHAHVWFWGRRALH